MFSMTGHLKRDRFVFVGWSGILLFPTKNISLLAGDLQEPPSLPVGTPMALRLHIWRGPTFLTAPYLLH